MRLFPLWVGTLAILAVCVGSPRAGGQTESPGTKPPVLVLDPILADPAFWSADATALGTMLKGSRFRWVSQDKTELRAGSIPMTYLDLAVVEAVIRLPKGKPSEVFLSLYNRGDVGRIGDDKFEEFVAKTETALATRSGGASEDLGDALTKYGIRATSKSWITGTFSARLDTAYSRVREEGDNRKQDRPEFVNLTIYPPGTPKEGMLVQRMAETAEVDFKKRVQHKDNGDVLIEGMPMVDQGKKGYCAVATMERILRYYGSEVNQHELAQQANASGSGGTNPEALVKALRGMGGKVGLRVEERESFDLKDFFRLLDDYNREAKREKEPLINIQGLTMIPVGEIYASMKVPILRKIRLKNSSKVDSFFKDTSETVDLGRPVAWSVQLGWVDETPALPQASGGHMRLIIGYNPQKKEILYTDSWGYGHELKRMSAEDAYLITTGLYVVEPKG